MKALRISPINVMGLLCLISSVGAAAWGYRNISLADGETTLWVRFLGGLILFGAAQLITVLVFWVVHSVTRRYPDLRGQNAQATFWLWFATVAIIVAAIGLAVAPNDPSQEAKGQEVRNIVVGLAIWLALLPHASARLLPRFEEPVTATDLRKERAWENGRRRKWDYPVDSGRHWILFTLGMVATVGLCYLTLRLTLAPSLHYTEAYLYKGDFAYPHIAGECIGFHYVEDRVGGEVSAYVPTLLDDQLAYYRANRNAWVAGVNAFWAMVYLVLSCIMKMWYMHVTVDRNFGWVDVLSVGVTRAIRILLILCVSTGAQALYLSYNFDTGNGRVVAYVTLALMISILRFASIVRRPGVPETTIGRGGEAQNT